MWEEQRAAAERNRRQAAEADRPGGLAAFLGVPGDDAGAGPQGAPEAGRPRGGAAGPTDEERWVGLGAMHKEGCRLALLGAACSRTGACMAGA